MALDLINQSDAEKIKQILLEASLNKPILIKVNALNLELNINGVSVTQESSRFSEMKEMYFMNEEQTQVLNIDEKSYELFLNIGEWGSTTRRFPGLHICLGTRKLGDYFLQIELSQCIQDDEKIYIVKNVSSFRGPGAI